MRASVDVALLRGDVGLRPQVWVLSGSTADKIYAQLTPAAAQARGLAAPPPPRLVWEKSPYPPDAAEQYWFTR